MQAHNTCLIYSGTLGTTVPVFNSFVEQVGLIHLSKHSAMDRTKPIW